MVHFNKHEMSESDMVIGLLISCGIENGVSVIKEVEFYEGDGWSGVD